MQRQPVSTCTHTAPFAGHCVCVCACVCACVCVCAHSQVSVEVESDVGDIRTVQSQNMLLKCFSQHLTQSRQEEAINVHVHVLYYTSVLTVIMKLLQSCTNNSLLLFLTG